jgi:DNA damage-binding protein 1
MQSFFKTRVLAMAGEELEETEVVGFVQDQQTLYCGNAINNHIIQVTHTSLLIHSFTAFIRSYMHSEIHSKLLTLCVFNALQITPKGVHLIDATKQQLADKWTPPTNQSGSLINVCSCNTHQILVSVGGKNLHLLEINNSKLQHIKSLSLSLFESHSSSLVSTFYLSFSIISLSQFLFSFF